MACRRARWPTRCSACSSCAPVPGTPRALRSAAIRVMPCPARVAREDLAHDGRLFGNDLQAEALGLAPVVHPDRHAAVAVGHPASVETPCDLTGQTPADLGRQVAPIHLVDDAAHAAQHETRLARVAVVAVRNADQTNATVLEATDDLLLIDLVTGQPVEPLQDEHVELARQRCGMHRRTTGTAGHRDRAAGGFIGELRATVQTVVFSPRSGRCASDPRSTSDPACRSRTVRRWRRRTVFIDELPCARPFDR